MSPDLLGWGHGAIQNRHIKSQEHRTPIPWRTTEIEDKKEKKWARAGTSSFADDRASVFLRENAISNYALGWWEHSLAQHRLLHGKEETNQYWWIDSFSLCHLLCGEEEAIWYWLVDSCFQRCLLFVGRGNHSILIRRLCKPCEL